MPDGTRPDDKSQNRLPRARISRAVRLLEQLIDRGLAADETLAHALGMSRRQLEDCRTGILRMPLHSQRQLANLVIDYVPDLAREARRLQLQCNAEQIFKAKETETHMIAPPRRFR